MSHAPHTRPAAYAGRVRRFAAAGVGAGVALALSVAPLASASTSSAQTQQAKASTTVVHVRPTDDLGHKLPGYRVVGVKRGASCEPSSEVVVGALRCFAGHFVLDPCWLENASHPQALCMSNPFKHEVVRLRLRHLDGYPSSHAGRLAWGIKLRNGNHCVAVQGTHDFFHGHAIDFACHHRTSLLGNLHRRHNPWYARTVISDSSGVDHRGPRRAISMAVIGLPSWQPTHG